MMKSLGISIVIVAIAVAPAQISAEQRPGRHDPEPGRDRIPHSEKIASELGDVQWGWGHEEVIALYTKQLRDVFRPMVARAPNPTTKERLRRRMNARIHRIESSYIEFEGQPTGWDTSLIRDQYAHNNDEALVEVREIRPRGKVPRFTDYFFFFNDHLWRIYRAFDQDQFEGISFQRAAGAFQRRFGLARQRRRGRTLVALEWRDDDTRLEARDNTELFGVFCLIFSEETTAQRLGRLPAAVEEPEVGSRRSKLSSVP